MKNSKRVPSTPMNNEPKETVQKKAFLSESEIEAYNEYQESKQNFTNKSALLGSLDVQEQLIKEQIAKARQEAIFTSMQTEALEKRFVDKVQKYGQFQIGENFEVIKQ